MDKLSQDDLGEALRVSEEFAGLSGGSFQPFSPVRAAEHGLARIKFDYQGELLKFRSLLIRMIHIFTIMSSVQWLT